MFPCSSDRFKEDIERTGEEVESLNEARGERLNRVKFVEKEKDALEEGKREAERFLKQANEVRGRVCRMLDHTAALTAMSPLDVVILAHDQAV